MNLKEKYRNMRIFVIGDLAVILIGCFSLMAVAPTADSAPVVPLGFIFLGLILMIPCAVYTEKHIRCPRCKKRLRFRGIFNKPNFCAECGEKLDL